ncbi:Flp family type IVb pilin [Chelatococcus reniformis]|uniref:Flp family type IVb pilin n=1 Tax=Chelatococcus reniformis TaxID=1494448 RepID=A0A916XPZ1_9HYPH|nr:Flp family type IVb pilin [Chelatococcus reniformis]GGC93714.1 hypothetical protein GCM10010994_59390 [Chelatococcus reniformis]
MAMMRGGRATPPNGQRFSAAAIEQLLIAALIAVAIVTALGTLRSGLTGVLNEPGTPEYAAARRG